MKKKIVVFEYDELYDKDALPKLDFNRKESPKLDFRPVRKPLPEGACPLAIANHNGFVVCISQWFDEEIVIEFAEKNSGFLSGFAEPFCGIE